MSDYAQKRSLVLPVTFATAASAFVLGIAGLINTGIHEGNYNSPFAARVNDVTYSLRSDHTVQIYDDSGIHSFVNFNTGMLVSGKTQGVSFGGAGYGGMVPLDKAPETVRQDATIAGCFIAQSVIPEHDPHWTYDFSFNQSYFAAQENRARTFAANYCDPAGGPKTPSNG